MKNLFIVAFTIFLSTIGHSQTKKEYIYEYASVAVSEMEYAKIPASITLAQGILESRFGLSELSSKANNHFGIKCHNGWNGGRTYHDDDRKGECFRAYKDAEQSFRDHSDFLSKRGRYSDLFKLSLYDYKGWAKGLRKAGYATNPRYADHLIKIIEDEKLYVFDRMNSEEVGPYIASLQNPQKKGDVMWAKADKKPTRVNRPEEPDRVTKKDKTIEIIGGPAASPEKEVSESRDIFIVNDIQTVRSFEGDSQQKIADYYDIPVRRLKRYNEWDLYWNEFEQGMKVYLQPKRSKSRDISKLTHVVQPGETMYQIAQQYGIRTDKLYDRNMLSEAMQEQPHPGEIIQLRKNRDTKPKLLDPSEVFTEEKVRTIDDGEGEAIGRPDQTEEETEEFIDKEIIRDEPVEETEKSRQTSGAEAAQNHEESTQQSPAPNEEEGTDPFAEGEYPSNAPAGSQTTDDTPPAKDNQKQKGRSVIHDKTPEINKQPVEIYEPPVSAKEKNQQTEPEQAVRYHKVVKGDTLYSLSKEYKVSVKQLKDWNELEGSNIKLGQKLIVEKQE